MKVVIKEPCATIDAGKQNGAPDQHLHQQLEDPSPFVGAAAEQLPSQAAVQAPQKKQSARSRLLACSCFRPPAVADEKQALPSSIPEDELCLDVGTPCSVRSSGSWKFMGSPSRRHMKSTPSHAYSDAEWHDAVSQFSVSADHTALVDEMQTVVKELGPFEPPPWVPNPPLVFGTPNMQFIKVPVNTGFSAYWERDDERTTPFPQPIDCMLNASYLVKKTHASIPGILIQETPTGLTITATPGFMPPFLPFKGYEETYDKSNKTEPSWIPRRDLKMGRAWGKLYMTTDNMLIARVWQRPAFSDEVDIIMEEYMLLEQGGEVIVDKMTCLHVASGKRASQYLVGHKRELPPKTQGR